MRRAGYAVQGFDTDRARTVRAQEIGAIDIACDSAQAALMDCEIAVIATSVSEIATLATLALDAGVAVVTDVGSVKSPLVAAIEQARPTTSSRFVGGHPMAGSEQDGIEGARADLFEGAVWVLTPTVETDPATFASVRTLVSSFGAEAVALSPHDHDQLVAIVSHVPHLAATTLMDLAARNAEGQGALLRMAAGGFRDMTRIAAGHPGIWPDICVANRDAIVTGLSAYIDSLKAVRSFVEVGNREGLLEFLERARIARRSLPIVSAQAGDLVEIRIPVPDQPGILAAVTTMASQMDVNIIDLEIAHSAEGTGGVLVLVVPLEGASQFESALALRGFRPTGVTI